jgi:uncharacterized metal-binding protein
MENNCCSCAALGSRIVLSCSGASNFGQISNSLAVEMQSRGMGNMSCLAAVAAGLEGYLKSAREADQLVVIDGCNVACGQKIMQAAAIENYTYFVVSDNLPDVTKEKAYDQIAKNTQTLWDYLIESL